MPRLIDVLVILALLGLAIWAVYQNSHRNSEVTFKGKQYVIAGLQGAGYTHEHRSPVYTLVVMSKEDSKKWTKK